MSRYRHRSPSSEYRRYRSPSPMYSRYRSRSPKHSRYRSPSPEHNRYRSRSPKYSRYQSHSPKHSRYRSPSPEYNRYRSRSPKYSRYRSPSPRYRRHRSPSPLYAQHHNRTDSPQGEYGCPVGPADVQETLLDESSSQIPSPSEVQLPFEEFLGEEEDSEEEEDPFCSDSIQFGSFKEETKMFDRSLEELEGTERVGFRYRGLEYYCDVCDIHVTSMAALQGHFAGTRHQKRLKQVGLDVDLTDLVKCPADPELKRKLLRCKLCDVVVRGSEMSVHTRCASHQEKLQFFDEEDQTEDAWFNEVAVNPDSFLKSLDDGYHCDLCGVTLPSNDLFRKHLDGKRHQKKLRWEFLEQTEDNHGDSNQLQYWCKICNIFCTSKEALDKHFTGKKHIKMLKSKGVVTEDGGTPSEQDIGCTGDFAGSQQWKSNSDDIYSQHSSLGLPGSSVFGSSRYDSSSSSVHGHSSSGHSHSGHTSFDHSSSGHSSSGHGSSRYSSSSGHSSSTGHGSSGHSSSSGHGSSGHVSSSGQIASNLNQLDYLEQTETRPGEGNQVQYWCKICNIFCTCKEALDMHFVGKKHAKVLKSKGVLTDNSGGENGLRSTSSEQKTRCTGDSVEHTSSSRSSSRRDSSGHISSSGPSKNQDQPSLDSWYGQPSSIHRHEQDQYTKCKQPLSIYKYEQQLSVRQHEQLTSVPPPSSYVSRHKRPSYVRHDERPSSSTSSQRSSHPKTTSVNPFAITPLLKFLNAEDEPDSTSPDEEDVTFEHISSKQQAVNCLLCDKILQSNALIREHLDSKEHLAALALCSSSSNTKLQDIIVPARRF